MIRRTRIGYTGLSSAFFLILVGCGLQKAPTLPSHRLSGHIFGTTWSVVVVGRDEPSLPTEGELEATIKTTLNRVDALMSTFRADSELHIFNKTPDLEFFEFSPESRMVIDAALHFARETEGALDPTVAPLVRAWGFGAGSVDEDPVEEELNAAREIVGWQLLIWDDSGRLVRAKPGVQLDLSAIAKGYGVDALIQALSAYRPSGLMVEIGGDLRAVGVRPSGESWRLGIQQPGAGLHSKVLLSNHALATSGDYRQYRGEGPDRRTHIIDPRSGQPALVDVASVSVIAPTALEADSIATALVVMGKDEGLKYVEERPWLEALIMVRDSGEEGRLEHYPSSGWPAPATDSPTLSAR